MFPCMRTTIHIDDQLYVELKRIAADTGRTLTAVIQDALRESLSRRHKSELPLFRGTGLMPGVDLGDAASLLDVMERDRGPA